MELHTLTKVKTQKKKKRLGRGYGSGKGGHTVGKGTKGQKARGSRKVAPGFEGGQVPLYKKLPKRPGFNNKNAKDTLSISLAKLNRFADGTVVTPASLKTEGIIRRLPKDNVKVLSTGELTKKLKLQGFVFSKQAHEKVLKSGSEIL